MNILEGVKNKQKKGGTMTNEESKKGKRRVKLWKTKKLTQNDNKNNEKE